MPPALRRELEELRSRMDNLPTEQLAVRGEGTQVEWRSAVEKVEERVRGVEERVESNSQRVERAVEMCTAKAEGEEGLSSSSSSSSSSSRSSSSSSSSSSSRSSSSSSSSRIAV